MIHREAAANSTSVQPDTPPPFRPAGELGDWWRTGLRWDGLAQELEGGASRSGREAKYGCEQDTVTYQRSRSGFLTGAVWPCGCGAALPAFSVSLNLVSPAD